MSRLFEVLKTLASQKHRVELVDGCLEVLPMATIFHQLYREHGVFTTADLATSVLLPGFTVNVHDLFAQADAAAES